jgi:(2S)-methylsuccinyl-CoA dehydrogenase
MTGTVIDNDQLLNQATTALAQAQQLLQASLADLRSRSLDGDRVSPVKLDEHQLVSYELALCSSESAAATFMLDYAKELHSTAGDTAGSVRFEDRLAALFCAEAVNSIGARLRARPADFGLDDATINAALGQDAVVSFLTQQLTATNIATVGQQACERGGDLGADLLDDDHTMMRDSFRRFADEVVMPLAEEVHRQDLIIPEEILGALRDMGCFGLSIPASYGGIQDDEHEDNMGMIIVTEELSRGSLGAAGSLITRPEILSRALKKGGTEEQKQYWLPKLAAGDPLCAVAVTEPNYGSDVASVRLKATRTEGGWLLNGAKAWCTFGGKAGVLLVLARTNPDLAAKHKGLSTFLLEKPVYEGHDFEFDQEGGGKLTGRAIATIGYRGMHSFDLFFDNVFVPEENMLGGPEGEGKGFYYTMAGFAGGRIQTAARAVGVMQAAFERSISYAQDRVVFQHPIADYQLTQVKLARMAAYLAACRQFTFGVAKLMDRGEGDMEASMVKLLASKTAEWVTREALQIHGGMGYAEETPTSRYFVDARVLSIFEGAEETLALKVIIKTLLDSLPSQA